MAGCCGAAAGRPSEKQLATNDAANKITTSVSEFEDDGTGENLTDSALPNRSGSMKSSSGW